MRERALYYYLDLNKGCAEALFRAASDKYCMDITDREAALFEGFRGGIGCGNLCGALSGAIGAICRILEGQEGVAPVCAEFLGLFQKELEQDSTLCSVLSPVYKNPERRCAAVVERTADLLEAFVADKELLK